MKTNQEINPTNIKAINAVNDFIQKHPSLAYVEDIKKYCLIEIYSTDQLSPQIVEHEWTFKQLQEELSYEYQMYPSSFRSAEVRALFKKANRVFWQRVYTVWGGIDYCREDTYLPYDYIKQFETMKTIVWDDYSFHSDMHAAFQKAPWSIKTAVGKLIWLRREMKRYPKKYYYVKIT